MRVRLAKPAGTPPPGGRQTSRGWGTVNGLILFFPGVRQSSTPAPRRLAPNPQILPLAPLFCLVLCLASSFFRRHNITGLR